MMPEHFAEHRNLRIAGTIVLYQPDQDVISNIKSYFDEIEVLYVIDNSETMKSDIVQQILQFDKIVYLPNGENLGIATALNIAAVRAITDGYDFLLTMDQDSCAESGMINNLLRLLNYVVWDEIGIVSPVHVVESNPQSSNNGFFSEVKSVMTSGNLLNLKAYTKVGRFADDLFVDCVDHDYCLRLTQAGFKIFQVNKSVLHHKLGLISQFKLLHKTLTTSNHSPLRRYYNTRNRFYIWNTYGDYAKEFVMEDKCSFRGEIRNILFGESERFAKFCMMIRGYLDYRNNKFGKYER